MKRITLFILCLLCGLNVYAQESTKKAFDSTIARHPVIFGIHQKPEKRRLLGQQSPVPQPQYNLIDRF